MDSIWAKRLLHVSARSALGAQPPTQVAEALQGPGARRLLLAGSSGTGGLLLQAAAEGGGVACLPASGGGGAGGGEAGGGWAGGGAAGDLPHKQVVTGVLQARCRGAGMGREGGGFPAAL